MPLYLAGGGRVCVSTTVPERLFFLFTGWMRVFNAVGSKNTRKRTIFHLRAGPRREARGPPHATDHALSQRKLRPQDASAHGRPSEVRASPVRGPLIAVIVVESDATAQHSTTNRCVPYVGIVT